MLYGWRVEAGWLILRVDKRVGGCVISLTHAERFIDEHHTY